MPLGPQPSPCPHQQLNSAELCVLKIEIQKKFTPLSKPHSIFFYLLLCAFKDKNEKKSQFCIVCVGL